MKVIEATRTALPVFAEHKDSDWETLGEALEKAGISPFLTDRLLEFMPLAFGKVFLDGTGIQFADYYVRYDPETGRKKQKQLSAEPVYAESIWAASEILARQAAGEAFKAVVFRSSELSAVNEALNNGSQPENLLMSPPPVMVWQAESDDQSNF